MSSLEQPDATRVSEMWNRASATYGHVGPAFFSYFGKKLAAASGVRPGSKVLDVACGRGAVLFPLSRMVGENGHVTGIDFSEGMVAETAAEAETLGLSNVQVRRMNAEQLDFTDNMFDVVTCGFAIFFFPNLSRALAEFRRVIKPGGALLVSTWTSDDPRWKWLSEILPKPKSPPNTAQPAIKFDEPDSMRGLLLNAGFQNPQVIEDSVELFYQSSDDFWDTLWSHGARMQLEKLPTEKLSELRGFASTKLAELQVGSGIPYLFSALYTRATKPAE